ncbi:MAG: carboxypeptidase-like regulatory domain-containing protein, partial [Pyrinomonadaceae bacterium]
MRLAQISILTILLSLAVLGQTNKGSISGSVTDQKGAAVPGATVIITNVATKQTVTLVTSQEGLFAATLIEPVTYDVLVEAKGFKKSLVEKI